MIDSYGKVQMDEVRRAFTSDQPGRGLSGLSRPLNTIKPLSVSTTRLDQSAAPKLSGISGLSGGLKNPSLAPRGQHVIYPKTRDPDGGPFQINILKGIVGLGAKVKVNSDGFAEIVEIQRNGPVDKNGQIR